VDRGPVLVVHLIKLVDETGSPIRKNHGTTFEGPFAGHRIAANAGRETDGTGALSRGKDCPVSSLLDVLEDLRLGGTGVTEQKHIDVTTDGMLALGNLADTSE